MGLQNLLEDYRNWVKTQEWKNKKQDERLFGGDPVLQEEFEKWSGGFSPSNLGGGLSGLAGAIKASHGSPHAHTKFDFSKIGTGEGAQAYGYGGYFGQGFDSPVAKEYQERLADWSAPFTYEWKGQQYGHDLVGDPVRHALGLSHHNGVKTAKSIAKSGLKDALAGEAYAMEMGGPEYFQKMLDAANQMKKSDIKAYQGHLYNVELKWPDAAREAADPLGEHHLLDWDARLSEQPESVKKYWAKLLQSKIGSLADKSLRGALLKQEGQFADPTGQDIYSTLSEGLIGYGKARPFLQVKEEASNRLAKAGIPGIRYLDQGSRSTGEGTRNYVMFDDRFPNIVSRNGVSLADLLRK